MVRQREILPDKGDQRLGAPAEPAERARPEETKEVMWMHLDQAALEDYLSRVSGAPIQIEGINELGGGTGGAAALKAFGYGQPMCIDYRPLASGKDGSEPAEIRRVVLRRISRNSFGRERDADRVAEVWLNFHSFNHLPRHIQAQDMVALVDDGRLESAGHIRELLLLTDYAPGQLYAGDLTRIRDEGMCTDRDRARAEALADYLVGIHTVKHDDPLLWRRRLRDLVGHGEGIMGLTDSYPADFPLTPVEELRAIEVAANEWRWRLKSLTGRLSQVHGDFHPFNVLFTEQNEFTLLDRSRGEWGEPADDASCMTINYLFFSLQRYGRLAGPFENLYTAFWSHYLAGSHDDELLSVIQPWFAWRTLVLASPQWYPSIHADVRRRLLTFARRVMASRRFEWRQINDYLEAA